jgi:predicted lipoprotein with Yx(FWY)xxD motif
VTATAPSPQASVQPATLTVANSRYGKIIVDSSGRTLYLFDAESSAVPRCYGPCATAWPPLLTSSAPIAGQDLSQSLIATAKRTDGSTQVTYNGHLLYYYVGDRSPGEIKCQAAVEYGGGWYVLDLHGNKISAP